MTCSKTNRQEYDSYLGPWDLSYWTDAIKEKPERYELRYNIKYDTVHTLYSMVDIAFDSNGRYIFDDSSEIYGFEKRPNDTSNYFKLSYAQAIVKAQKRGLLENDTNKADVLLKWESFKTKNLYDGRFLLYVVQLQKSERYGGKDYYTQVNYFNVWVFNPWTGDFIEKKKMRNYFEWHGSSGFSTDLSDDF